MGFWYCCDWWLIVLIVSGCCWLSCVVIVLVWIGLLKWLNVCFKNMVCLFMCVMRLCIIVMWLIFWLRLVWFLLMRLSRFLRE